MTTTPIVIVGAGGFGRETLDVIEAINAIEPTWDVLGVLDDAAVSPHHERVLARGYQILGSVEAFLRSMAPVRYVLAIGAPAVRERIAARMASAGHRPATVLHPNATIGSRTRVGAGVVLCAGVQISTNVALGDHVHVNPNATIGHDTMIDAFSSVNPAATISGEVHVGARSLIGAGSVVLQGLSVGHDAVVGASACVTRDVLPNATVKGVPAR